jgi:hypothetical protein
MRQYETRVTFEADPLAWLGRLAESGQPVRWAAPGRLCVADAALARAILRNDGARYAEHSDFFGTETGLFGPRSLQVEIGRRGRAMAESHLRDADYAGAVEALGPASRWPGAGNRLMLGLTRSLLSADHRAPRFNRLLDAIVVRGIFERDSAGRGDWRRRLRRFRFFLAFASERERREREGETRHRDILDLVLDVGGEAPTGQLLEIFLGFVFAIAGSVGFALGWSVMLAIRHDETAARPKDILSEALRLYPVAWLFERRPRVEHDLAGITVGPSDRVLVSPYAVHRNPASWPDPEAFRPGRWREAPDRAAWLPFGAGAHTCAAVSLTFQIVERVLSELFGRHEASLSAVGARPGVAAALAPPPFTLELAEREKPGSARQARRAGFAL